MSKGILILVLGIVVALAIVGFYLYSKSQKTVVAQQNQLNQDPWVTVPAAVNNGLAGVGSLFSSLNNLFTPEPSTTEY